MNGNDIKLILRGIYLKEKASSNEAVNKIIDDISKSNSIIFPLNNEALKTHISTFAESFSDESNIGDLKEVVNEFLKPIFNIVGYSNSEQIETIEWAGPKNNSRNLLYLKDGELATLPEKDGVGAKLNLDTVKDRRNQINTFIVDYLFNCIIGTKPYFLITGNEAYYVDSFNKYLEEAKSKLLPGNSVSILSWMNYKDTGLALNINTYTNNNNVIDKKIAQLDIRPKSEGASDTLTPKLTDAGFRWLVDNKFFVLL